MSAKRPNSQQQNKWSKALIHPEKGLGFISNDYSQIEFRLIIHYIKDEAAIKAYCENPNTDFHQWVADMIGVVRKRAKTLNFGMAYGQGKKGVVGRLASDPSIIEEIGGHINKEIELGHIAESQRHAAFIAECVTRSEESYNAYHEKFPGIKSTSREAMEVAKFRGYVFNAYGRRRHLPPDQCHKAFNAIIQGLAMDVMKEAMIKLSPRYNDESKKIGLTIGANVHDELLNKVPLESLYEQSTWKFIKFNMENPSVQFRIPIVTEMGISANSWAEANSDKPAVLPDGKPVGRVHLP
jgi:DNA polymerase-1